MKNSIILSIILFLTSCTPIYISSQYLQAPPKDEVKKILLVINNEKAPKDYYKYFDLELRRSLKRYKIELQSYSFNENTISPKKAIKANIQKYQSDVIMYISTSEIIRVYNYSMNRDVISEIITKVSMKLPNNEDTFWEASLKTGLYTDEINSTEVLVEKLIQDEVIKNQEVN